MLSCARLVSIFTLIVLLLPHLGAQDKKGVLKDDLDKKEAKKEDDLDKKDAKKETDKKSDPKAVDEDKVNYGQKITARLKRMDANSARDFAIELPQVDPQKVNQLNMWKMQEWQRIMTTDPRQRGQQMMQFQMQLARKQNTEIYTMKDFDLRASETCKVRAMFPPIEYDDKGRLKVWTKKELLALKGTSKLPGYPADFDRLNAGQIVTVYLAKTLQPMGGAAAKKKKLDDDDDDIVARPEVVMIVLEQEAPFQPR